MRCRERILTLTATMLDCPEASLVPSLEREIHVTGKLCPSKNASLSVYKNFIVWILA